MIDMHDTPAVNRMHRVEPYKVYGVLGSNGKLLCELTTSPSSVRRINVDTGLAIFPRENYKDTS